MKATRQEWVDDLKALDEMLYKFLVKHGRSGVNDLEMVHSIESGIRDGEIVTGKDEWTIGAELAATGFEASGASDEDVFHAADQMWEDVREGLKWADIAEVVER